MATHIKFKNVYSLFNDLDATVIETLLEESNITCSVRVLGSIGGMRVRSAGFQERLVSVEEELADDAVRIITEAIRSGIISNDGKFRS